MSTKTDDRLLGMLDARAFCLVEPLLGTWSTLRKALRGAHNLSKAGRSPTSIRIVDRGIVIKPEQILRLWRQIEAKGH
jgi:hypothetical protein